jgi:hypothetical protein
VSKFTPLGWIFGGFCIITTFGELLAELGLIESIFFIGNRQLIKFVGPFVSDYYELYLKIAKLVRPFAGLRTGAAASRLKSLPLAWKQCYISAS